jgi:DNA invertase Pin-like site-specific DNA recombinase
MSTRPLDFTPIDDYPLAYSYVRFSTSEQLDGDSLRRQTEAAAEWCQRNSVCLDTSLTLRDLGVSAFRGKHRQNPDRNALAAFLKLVEQGRVPRGSYLVIENLDRLSREEEVPACNLLTGILMAGITVVQLKPSEFILTDKSNGWDIMRAVMELSRGHNESVMKSERNGKAWQERLARARAGEKVLTRQLPAWIEEKDGKLVLIPSRAAVVKRIYDLAVAGYGAKLIVGVLTKEKEPPFGDKEEYTDKHGRARHKAKGGKRLGSGIWVRSYVTKILKDRRAIGEHQPCGKGRKPKGKPIPGYFPAVVTEDQYNAARAAIRQRRQMPGKTTATVNLFAGLLRHAKDGDSFFVSRVSGNRVFVNRAGHEGRSTYVSFHAGVLERAILSKLREIDPKSILKGANGHNEVVSLEDELGQINAELAGMKAWLDKNKFSAEMGNMMNEKVTTLADRREDVSKRLNEAKRKAKNPLSASWGETHSLIDVLDTATDQQDARLRLRSAMRRIIKVIHVLIAYKKHERLAFVQVQFTEGCRLRTYLIRYCQSNGKRKGFWQVKSHDDEDNTDIVAEEGRPDDMPMGDHCMACDTPEKAKQRLSGLESLLACNLKVQDGAEGYYPVVDLFELCEKHPIP